MPTIVHGLPATLWRGYRELAHAESLVRAGHVRLQSLRFYRAIEDTARRDSSEGVARLRVPGDVPVITIDANTAEVRNETTQPGLFNFSAEFLNPTYLFCLSTERTGAARFGNTIVEIFDTRQLIRSLEGALQSLEPALDLAFLEAFPVRYDKDTIAPAPELPKRLRLAYGQKEASFAPDSEYRAAVVLAGRHPTSPEHLDLVLEHVTSFARILPDWRAA